MISHIGRLRFIVMCPNGPILKVIRSFFFPLLQSDAYHATGCYNLLCSGFVQTNNKIAIGAAISPVSSFSGGQFDITILIWKVRIWIHVIEFL